jgi:cell division transport system permease protein
MTTLRPRGADDLGLRRALSDRLLPLLVAAMVFLAALAAAGGIAAAGLAAHWRGGAAQSTTIQVPASQAAQAAAILGPAARRLPDTETVDLLTPWLGADAAHLAIALPTIFILNNPLPAAILAKLIQAAPGALVAQDSVWQTRLATLAQSLEACADLALLVTAFVAAAVVAVATRAGLAARRDAIEIVHGLGATDGMIANRFAARVTILVLSGAILGAVFSVPMLLGLAGLTAPFQAHVQVGATLTPMPAAPARVLVTLATLAPLLWIALASLPPLAAAIGWLTAQLTVRNWLARLP